MFLYVLLATFACKKTTSKVQSSYLMSGINSQPREANFNEFYANNVEPFAGKVVEIGVTESAFASPLVASPKISTAKAIKKVGTPHSRAIIISSGRTETFAKYFETMYDFYQAGFDVFTMDHRGQGRSTRLNPYELQMGHLDSYQYMVGDFRNFVRSLPLENYEHVYLFAHSMGAMVATHFLLDDFKAISSNEDIFVRKENFKGLILSDPLLGLKVSWVEKSFLTSKKGMRHLASIGDQEIRPLYAIGPGGEGEYNSQETLGEAHTQSYARYTHWKNISESVYADTLMGSPSIKWVEEMIKASGDLQIKLNSLWNQKFTTPVLTLISSIRSAENVNQDIPERICRTDFLSSCTCFKVQNGKHELMFETDSVRKKVFQKTVDFFNGEIKPTTSQCESI